MVDYLARPVIHEAFFKKYASKKFLKGKKLSSATPRPALLCQTLTCSVASILARQWAKKNAQRYNITDIGLSLDDIST